MTEQQFSSTPAGDSAASDESQLEVLMLASLRQRLRGWRLPVNVAAQAYGLFAMFLLAKPADADTLLDRWIVLIGAALVLGSGLAYMFIAKPYDGSQGIPEGDAIEVADKLRRARAGA